MANKYVKMYSSPMVDPKIWKTKVGPFWSSRSSKLIQDPNLDLLSLANMQKGSTP